jgi:diacylglycerol kinase
MQEPRGDEEGRTRGSELRHALRGIKAGIRGHWSFFLHFFFAALVIATAAVVRCDILEWCLLLGCIAFVLVAELFQRAVQEVTQRLERASMVETHAARDIAAGAVLLARIASAVIGGMILLSRLLALFPPASDA